MKMVSSSDSGESILFTAFADAQKQQEELLGISFYPTLDREVHIRCDF